MECWMLRALERDLQYPSKEGTAEKDAAISMREIFRVQYRVLNGAIEKLTVGQTKVSSSGNGTLEVKFPRNL